LPDISEGVSLPNGFAELHPLSLVLMVASHTLSGAILDFNFSYRIEKFPTFKESMAAQNSVYRHGRKFENFIHCFYQNSVMYNSSQRMQYWCS